MFGLMTIKEHIKQLSDIKHQLAVEKSRSAYWKLKYLQPEVEPMIFGNSEDIKYIKK